MSALFRHIEQHHQGLAWGRFLDAGTGLNSLSWIAGLDTEAWTAVTADPGMAKRVAQIGTITPRPADRLLVGNWMDPALLAGERFDTVLMDYFIGAIEGFSPYWQEQVLQRFRPLVGRRLYITGLDPYVPYTPDTEAGEMICQIGRLRDACLLLAGERPYREYPLEWVADQVQKAGMRVVDARRFGNRYRERFVHGQLEMCERRLPAIADKALREGLASRIESLRSQALSVLQRDDGLRHGSDFVIVAEPAN